MTSSSTSTGGLVGFSSDSSTITNSYWATDASGQSSSKGGEGVTLAELQYPTAATGANYVDEDSLAYWDFGTSSQLPGLLLNGTVYRDSDGDGSLDADDDLPYDHDNDGVNDADDAFPVDATETTDTDGDGIGNNTDSDDDGDGIPDTTEDEYGLDPLDASDADSDLYGDGLSNLYEYEHGTDMSVDSVAPVITLTGSSSLTLSYGDTFTDPGAIATDGLDVSFTSITTSVCTVSGSTVSITGGGTCSITASQSGDDNYNAATDVTQSFTVEKAGQSITFNALEDKTLGDEDFDLSASSGSDLDVSFAASTTSVCTVSNTTVSLVSYGTCSITAVQSGDDHYNAATEVTQSFTVNDIDTDGDGDGIVDHADTYPNDYDNDGIDDDEDAYPNDYDNDGVDDDEDAFPEDATEWADSDGDGIGDNADDYPNDYDNDGVDDDEDAFPYDAAGSCEDDDIDSDDDGLIDISSLAELDAVHDDLAGTSLSGVTAGCPDSVCTGYELTTDLDFDTNGDGVIDENDDYWNDGEGWQPEGQSSTPFTAEFNGNGYVLRNLRINRDTESYVGFFGYIDGATITEFGLEGPLTSITGYSFVGTLVGGAYDSTLSMLYSVGSVSGNGYVGGLVGELNNSTLINSASQTRVSADSYAAGLVGVSYSGTVQNSIAVNTLSGYSSGEGVVAYTSGISSSETYWDADISGVTGGGEGNVGDGLTTSELQCPQSAGDSNCDTVLYSNWDDTVWDFGTDAEYPALIFSGVPARDSDGDGIWDYYDAFPDNAAASVDDDVDGLPDEWNTTCNSDCQADSGLTLDNDPDTAYSDTDEDDSGTEDSSASSASGSTGWLLIILLPVLMLRRKS